MLELKLADLELIELALIDLELVEPKLVDLELVETPKELGAEKEDELFAAPTTTF